MKIIIKDNTELLAERFSSVLQQEISASSSYHLCLAGGSTPKSFYQYLADNHTQDMDWNKVNFYWGDERCVPPTDHQSNYKMATDAVLKHLDINDSQVFRMEGERPPQEEADRYGAILKENIPCENGVPQFDLLILGMGEDGHTASIFPDQVQLWNSTHLCGVAVHPETGQKRITITGKVIKAAKKVIYLVTGKKKRQVVYQIISETGNYLKYPTYRVHSEAKEVFWYLDHDAASLLPASYERLL